MSVLDPAPPEGALAPPGPTPRSTGLPWWAGPAIVLAVAVTAVVAVGLSALLGAAGPTLLADGSPWWAEPLLRSVRDVLAALALGLLLLVGGVVSPPADPGQAPVPGGRACLPVIRLAAWCSAGAALATAAGLLITAMSLTGRPLLHPWTTADVLLLGGLGGLRVLGYAVVLLLGVAVVTARARHRSTLLRLAIAAALATALLGVSGHAAAHPSMVGVMAVHVLAASAWAGGLAALLVLRATGGTDVAVLLPRWSHLAGLCFGAVALSGVAAVVLRWPGGSPGTDWAWVALGKVVVLVALAVAGRRQRRHVVSRARAGEPVPWRRLARLGAAELVLMCAAAGGGVALAAA